MTARDHLLALVAARSGMALRDARVDDVVRAARAVSGKDDLDDVVAHADAAFVDAVVQEIVVPETYFFRHPLHLDDLQRRLVEQQPARIRLWSAGCASGEEAWSLAMMLDEVGLLSRAEILGTDISASLVEKARAGRYRGWSLRGDSGRRAAPFLRKDGSEHVVDDRLRSAVRFDVLNLAKDGYPDLTRGIGGFDAIFCRNVLYYLQKDVVQRAACQFTECLKDGGVVYTAAADPALGACGLRMIAGLGVAWVKERYDVDAPATPRRTAVAPPRRRRRPQPPKTQRLARPASEASTGTEARATKGTPTPGIGQGQGQEQGQGQGQEQKQEQGQVDAARALADKGRVDDALAAVDAAIKGAPLSVEAHHLRCVLLLARGDPAAALDEARRLLYVAPALVVGHLLMHRISKLLGDTAGARRAAASALREAQKLDESARLPLGDGLTAGAAAAECRRLLGPAGEGEAT